MPITSRINAELGVVFTTASGTWTAEENSACREKTLSSPSFDPRFSQLIDVRAVESIAISSETIWSLARSNLFAPTSRQAIVADKGLTFGVARMVEVMRNLAEDLHNVRVFRDLTEALRWLGIEAPETKAG